LGWPLARLAVPGVLALAAVASGAWWGTRAMHGDRFMGHAGDHTHFGGRRGMEVRSLGQVEKVLRDVLPG
jgi:hypothetical protein